MGQAKRVRKFGAVKRIIGQNDARLKKNQVKGEEEAQKKDRAADVVREVYVKFAAEAILAYGC